MRGNLPENEPKTKAEVFDQGLYEKMLKKNEGHKTYILHDGPPYANGEIHMGHALNKVLKGCMSKLYMIRSFIDKNVMKKFFKKVLHLFAQCGNIINFKFSLPNSLTFSIIYDIM